ncbi:MAG: transposase [Clostridia bacterium]|nr:transposase [Clostridia bacterium]
MDLPVRKKNRLPEHLYNENGVYFITICTEHHRNILCDITTPEINAVGAGVPDRPQIQLSRHGAIADAYIRFINDFYPNLSVDKYIIMPNHIHLLLRIDNDGRSGTPAPTKGNSTIAQFVSTLKRFCNKEYGENIWQRSYHDHIIRNQEDYAEIWQYIENNPRKWALDCYYTKN